MADAAAPAPGDAVASLQRRVAELEAQLAAERQQRNAERAARIRLQRAGRAERLGAGAAAASDEQQPAALSARAIGTLLSCFSRRNGTPRQPALVPAARSQLTLRRGVPADALSGLEGFSHAWVLYVFHANTNLHVPDERFKARVAVPRLDGGSRGVFATRTPHRPVPLGLSLGRLLAVDARRGVVTFQGLDLVDNTPVLDIKPYVRAAAPRCAHRVPHGRSPRVAGALLRRAAARGRVRARLVRLSRELVPRAAAAAPFVTPPPPLLSRVAPVACGDAAAEPLRVTAVEVPPEAAAALAAAYEAAEAARRTSWHQQHASGHQPPPPALYPTAAEFIQLVTQARAQHAPAPRAAAAAAVKRPGLTPLTRCVCAGAVAGHTLAAAAHRRAGAAAAGLPRDFVLCGG